MGIPLPDMLRRLRTREFEGGLPPSRTRLGLRAWAWLAKRPGLYRTATGMAAGILSRLGGGKRRIRSLPFASGWTRHRDLPAPQGKTFHALWREGKRP